MGRQSIRKRTALPDDVTMLDVIVSCCSTDECTLPDVLHSVVEKLIDQKHATKLQHISAEPSEVEKGSLNSEHPGTRLWYAILRDIDFLLELGSITVDDQHVRLLNGDWRLLVEKRIPVWRKTLDPGALCDLILASVTREMTSVDDLVDSCVDKLCTIADLHCAPDLQPLRRRHLDALLRIQINELTKIGALRRSQPSVLLLSRNWRRLKERHDAETRQNVVEAIWLAGTPDYPRPEPRVLQRDWLDRLENDIKFEVLLCGRELDVEQDLYDRLSWIFSKRQGAPPKPENIDLGRQAYERKKNGDSWRSIAQRLCQRPDCPHETPCWNRVRMAATRYRDQNGLPSWSDPPKRKK